MSEQAAERRPPPAAGGAQGKKYAGLTRNQWLMVGGVFVVALGYLWWRNKQASSAAASQQAATNVGSNECTDQNGNPVDCGELTAQELAAVENQLDQLQSQGYGGGGAGGGGGYYPTGGTTGAGPSGNGTAATTTQPAGTPTTSGGATSTGTATAAKTAGAISNLRSSNVTKTSFKASWNPAANATSYSYIVRDLASHTQVTSGATAATSVTVSGLKSGTDYNFGVQGLPGGAGNNMHVRTT